MTKSYDSGFAVEITEPNCGSAFLIGGCLVLTCAHVVGDVGSACEIRSKRTFGIVAGTVVWVSAAADLALIELLESIEVAPSRFGKFPAWHPSQRDMKVPFQFYGYPEWAATIRERQDEAQTFATGGRQIEGMIRVGDESPDNLLVLDADRIPEASSNLAQSSWGGASGSAIICDGVIVAVLKRHQRPDRPASLEAQPLHVVYDDPQWRSLLHKHGINPEFQVVELPDGGKSIGAQVEPIVPKVEIEVKKLRSQMVELLNDLDYGNQVRQFDRKMVNHEQAVAFMVQAPCSETQRWLTYRLLQSVPNARNAIKISISSKAYFTEEDLWQGLYSELVNKAKAKITTDSDSMIQYFCSQELTKPILISVREHDSSKQCFENLVIDRFWKPLNQALEALQSKRNRNSRIILLFAMNSNKLLPILEEEEKSYCYQPLRLPSLSITSGDVDDWLCRCETSGQNLARDEILRRLRAVPQFERQEPGGLLHQLCRGVGLPKGILELESLWGKAS